MKTTFTSVWFATALAAVAIGTPNVTAAQNQSFVPFTIAGDTTVALPLISPPPRLKGRTVHWFHWHPSRELQGRAGQFGSAAVVGLESMHDLAALREQYGFERVLAIPGLDAAEVSVTPAELQALLTNAPSDRRVRYVAPLGPTRKLLRLRNDPLLRTVNTFTNAPYEWQFAATHVDRALNLSQGSPTILACTIDTGVADIPDLAGKIDGRWYFAGQRAASGSDGTDVQGHGTAVASLIAANNDDGFGMAGFGGATHLISFRDEELSDTSIALALLKLTSLGCRIINMSFGGPEPLSPILRDAVDKTFAAGVLMVAGTGNEGAGVEYPAADLQPPDGGPSLGLAVGSSDVNGSTSSFSNTGRNLSLLAPGDYNDGCSGVLAAIPAVSKMWDGSCWPTFNGPGGGRYASVAGTSFSSPEVAGVAALVWAARPDLDSSKVTEIIKRSARHEGSEAWTPQRGFGVLDAAAALELATHRSSADVLSVTSFHAARGTRRLTATGRVVWGDGVAVEDANVACSATVGGLAVAEASHALSHGTFSCSWSVPRAHAGRLIGTVTVTDTSTRVVATRPFSVRLD
jgi:serine protease